MNASRRAIDTTLANRVTWQAAALLLAYPDDDHTARLATVAGLIEYARAAAQQPLAAAHAALAALDPGRAAEDYVATFGMAERTTMCLTYWSGADAGSPGTAVRPFLAAYRKAGVADPKNAAPDHLPVVLEFAALVDPAAGQRLLVKHRAAIDMLAEALTQRYSLYAGVLGAVRATLLPVTEQEAGRAADPAPAEVIALQPFMLSMPPRRARGVW